MLNGAGELSVYLDFQHTFHVELEASELLAFFELLDFSKYPRHTKNKKMVQVTKSHDRFETIPLYSFFKQINDNEFIYVSSYDPNRQRGLNFTLENFDKNTLKHKISASTIRWDDSIFRLTNYVKRSIVDNNEIIEKVTRKDTILDFDIEDLAPLNYVAETLNFFELNNLIRYEKRAGSPLINSHLLVRHKRFTIPLSCFILTIIAISVSSVKRRGGTGSNLAIGVALGFLYIFLDKIFSVLVIKSNFSPALASWGVLFVFFIIALFLLKKAVR